jgi:hypothetical protein
MTGGLLNIVSYGNQNIILNSNPKKSFFKTTYAKYTNFGMQKFRIDFTGLRNLRMSEESRFTFTVPRYAELLMDTYLVVTLPTIWSPIYPPLRCSDAWRPYEFRWIENLGTQMIKEITFSVGGQILQRMTGKYLLAQVQRDLNGTKRFLYDTMTGSTAELNDPANFSGRKGTYPNVYYNTSQQGPEPSIRGRKLYIPLNAWFCNNSRTAFPLVALQYNELQIDVVMRPVRELFVTRDINYMPPHPSPNLTPEEVAQAPFIQPNFNEPEYQFYRFLQPPPAVDITTADRYDDKRTDWNADVHLLSTYCFLSAEESRVFASQEQKYLLKEAYEWDFKNITGSHRVELQNTMGMVATWMFMFQRSDINQRNQWSNYTNWPNTNVIPDDVMPAPDQGYVIDCPIVTNTVLDLDYYSNYATVPHHANINVSANDLHRFSIGQNITVTYDATNTISGTIIHIIGTRISFAVSNVATTAAPAPIYNNTPTSVQVWGSLSSTYFTLNTPPFPYSVGDNYIVSKITCGLLLVTGSTASASISFQLNDTTDGIAYISPDVFVMNPPAATINTFTYSFRDCFIRNNNAFNLQYTSSIPIDWTTITPPGSSIAYYGTLTGYAVPYSSGIVTINSGNLPNVIGPGVEPDGTPSGLFITQDYSVENQREILQQLGILLNGSYRENMLESGVYNYVEKYIRTAGSAPFGLYVYNFGMDASNITYQPSGAINMSKFSTIELEFSTYPPPLDPSANFYTICDPETGVPIGVNKPQWRIYKYNYDLTVLEERYNVLTFIGGNCALMYAR